MQTFTSGAILNSTRTEPCKDCGTDTGELELAKHRGRCITCFDRYDESFRAAARDAYDNHLAITRVNTVLYAFRHDAGDIDFDPAEAVATFTRADYDGWLIDPTDAEIAHAHRVLTRWYAVYGINPILDAYLGNLRNPHPDDYFDLTPAGTTRLWLWYLETGNQDISWDPFYLAHAKQVLTRIERYFEQAGSR